MKRRTPDRGGFAMTELSSIEAIFYAALEQPTAEARVAYLDQACGGDAALRQGVERLLHAHARAGQHFLQGGAPAAPDLTATTDERPAEQVGTLVAGRYKLLEAIGE